MQAKGYLGSLSCVLALVMILLTGCAKPPTEKIATIQAVLNESVTKGATEFAPLELQSINQKLAVLDSLMAAKKYNKATILADSISMELTGLANAVEENGRQAAKQILMEANQHLAALKGLLNENNIALLDSAAADYQRKCDDGEARIAALQSALEGGNALEVYDSRGIVKDLEATVQTCNNDISLAQEQAAAKAKKPGRKKK